MTERAGESASLATSHSANGDPTAPSSIPGGTTRRLLYQPEDRLALSEISCLVRSNIEAFVATAEDIQCRSVRGGRKVPIKVGSVGIRCVHCAPPHNGGVDGKLRLGPTGLPLAAQNRRGAVLYPQSVSLVYQAVRNWQRYHIMVCTAIPDEVKSRYLELKNSKLQGKRVVTRAQYWERCCQRMGMVDCDNGIRLRKGYFEDSNEDVGDCDGEVGLGGRSKILEKNAIQGKVSTVRDTLGSDLDKPHSSATEPSRNMDETRFLNHETPLPQFCSSIEYKAHSPLHTMLTPQMTEHSGSPLQYDHGRTGSPGRTILEMAQKPQLVMGSGSKGGGSLVMTSDQTWNSPPLKNVESCYSPAQEGSNSSMDHDFANAKFVDNRSCPASSPACVYSREVLLHRLKLAHSTVQAMGEIRELPSIGNNEASGSKASDDGANSNHQEEELRFLGAELYELFSGIEWGNVSSGNENDTSLRIQQRKRRGGGGSEKGGGKEFDLLSQLGLPLSLCQLVSSLLGASGDRDGVYNSIDEVEEDLFLMGSYPEKYLFQSSMNGVELQHVNMSHDTLYGRNDQVSSLIEAYDRMVGCTSANKNELVLISGYSGTGKSSVVRKVKDHYVKKGACFISGKFDAMQQMQPFSAIVNALNEYCNQLAQDTSRIEKVRAALSAAFGSEGQFLFDLIPNLSKILPHSADVGEESVRVLVPDASRRLTFLVRILFRVTCSKANPVVLFLDDLQWSDAASLELLCALITDTQLDAVMFIGCYRDNEVALDHPLMAQLDRIQHSGNVSTTSHCISNLKTNDVNMLLSETLCILPRRTRSLAEVVLEKTGGNALFVVKFLDSLLDEGHLRFSLSTRSWEFDLKRIRAREIADDVVEFMKSKLLRLAPEVLKALKVAAAFGAICHEDMIRILDKDPASLWSISAALDIAVSEGLMSKVEGSSYGFSHDQIQSAAYQLIDEPNRTAFHLHIGQSLRRLSSRNELEDYLFVVADQLHRGADLITDHSEKVDVAGISLLAGKKAYAMSAFLPSLSFVKSGIAMVSDDDWDTNRELCFGLFNLCIENEYTSGDFDAMKKHLEHVFGRARTLEERLPAYFVLIESLGAQLLTDEAISTACKVLAQLGEEFPSDLTEATVKDEIMTTHALLSRQSIDDLIRMKEMQNTTKRDAMKFLNLLICYTYLGKKNYLAVAVCRMVQLSLSHGVCRESAYGFALYGIIQCGLLGDYAGGYRHGKLAMSLLDRFNARDFYARVYLTVYGFVNNWVEPIQSAVPQLKEAADVGLSTGDTEFAMVSAQNYHIVALASGKVLGSLIDEMQMYSKQMVELNQNFINTMNMPVRQATLNLMGKCADPTKLVGEEMDEENLLKNAEDGDQSTLMSLICFYRMWLEYLFGEYNRAAETAKKNRDVAKHNLSRFAIVCNYAFYSGLAALALARKGSQEEWRDTIDNAMSQMETWALSSEWNCQHKLELMKAEYFYLNGDFVAAAKGYEVAVQLASKHRFIHEEALALERSAIFHTETGDQETASKLFLKACNCYNQWGACSKTAQVTEYIL